jgi:aryl-alcohol dehydrogenase-like predicted oxidoreductase
MDGRAQQVIGECLRVLSRDDPTLVRVTSKIGFLPSAAVRSQIVQRGIVREEDLVGNHAMSPSYIQWQARQTAGELAHHPIDVLFLHNPETQAAGARGTYHLSKAITAAFEAMEEVCAAGLSQGYGVATWDGFDQSRYGDCLSVAKLWELARTVAGDRHKMTAIQFPISLIQLEAARAALLEGSGPIVESEERGLTLLGSSPLAGGRLPSLLEQEFVEMFGTELTPAQACLLFVRSIPGVSVVLTSPSSVEQLQDSTRAFHMPTLDSENLRRVIQLLT